MDDAAILLRLILLAGLLLCSAFFSSSEVALFSLPQIKIDSLRSRGRAGAAVAALLDSPRKLLVTLLLGNEVVNVSISAVSGYLLAHEMGLKGYQAVLITAGVVVVFGEIAPKTLAFRRAEALALIAARPLSAIAWLVTPLRLALERLVDSLVREEDAGGPTPMRRDELELLVEEMADSGELREPESRRIKAILDLEHTRVAEIMTPRTDMFTLPVELSAAEALPLVKGGNFSRVPVVHEDADHVKGILYARDLLNADPRARLGELARPALFVPELKRADDLLVSFRDERVHMAVVVDEFGGTAGLVTLDDVLHELFGTIPDELDERQASMLSKRADGSWLVDAGLPLDEFGEQTGIALDCQRYDTVGGWALNAFGHLPEEGERARADGLNVTAAAVRGTRIVKLLVEADKAGGES